MSPRKSPPPPSPSEPSPEVDGSFDLGAPTVTLAEELGDPTTAGPSPAEHEREHAAPKNHGALSGSASDVLDLGCAVLLHAPLSSEERQAFDRDLEAVLRKYDAPSFKYAEEFRLAGTTARIIVPRVIAKAMASEGATPDDSPSNRQEGQRQEHAFAKAGLAGADDAAPNEASWALGI